MPCQELFDEQQSDYKDQILEKDSFIVSIEASSTGGWKKYMNKKGLTIGINKFGKSAPYKKLFENYDLTSEKLVNLIQSFIKNN